jgi:hypothetical protein
MADKTMINKAIDETVKAALLLPGVPKIKEGRNVLR